MPQEAMALIAILLFFQLYVWKKPYDATWIAGRITRSTFGAGINKDSDVRAPTVETACVRHMCGADSPRALVALHCRVR